MTLSDDMRRLSEDFLEGYDVRLAYAEELRRDTGVFLQELDAEHQAMAAELTARLDEQESGRLAQAAEDARGRME